MSVKQNSKIDTAMPEWVQPVSEEIAATMSLEDWIARIPEDIRSKIDITAVKQWIIIPIL